MSGKTLYKTNTQETPSINKIYRAPSFYAQIISGLLITYCIGLYLQMDKITQWENIMVLVAIGIAIGVHGLTHLLMEVHYSWPQIF